MKHSRFLFYLTFVTLAALIPTVGFAHHCKGPHANDPECDSGGGGGGGGGNGGNGGNPTFLISVDPHEGWDPLSPTYDPPDDCLGSHPDKGSGFSYMVIMPKHECAILVTSEGNLLTDDIRIPVTQDGNGDIVSVRINGQDIVGKQGLWHTSDPIPIVPQTPSRTEDFTIHVDADNVTIWRCDTHLPDPDMNCDVSAGTVSLGDLIYVLQ